MIRVIVLAAMLGMAPLSASAHKVIASVFASGAMIEGEIGFSNGDMAANHLVEIFDGNGVKLGETTTDADGFFLFAPSQPVTHVFHADLGAGHVAHVEMAAEEVAAILGVAARGPVGSGDAPSAAAVADGAAAASLSPEARAAIAEIVRTETRSLRQEIARYREHHDLQTILGGIGYILGLFGLGFYLAARRRLAS